MIKTCENGKGVVINVCNCGEHCGQEGCSGCDCGCNTPEPEPTPQMPGILEVTIGDTGDFKTLREAQKYIRQHACTMARISLVSDVKEAAGEWLIIDGFSADPITIIDGGSHTLDLSNMNSSSGLVVINQRVRLQNIKIYSPNTTNQSLSAGHNAQIHLYGNVIVQGGGKGKSYAGIFVYSNGNMVVQRTGNEVNDCTIGVHLSNNSVATFMDPLVFTNVTTEFSPEKNTLGNKNSYISI